jgi:hypothetical protein
LVDALLKSPASIVAERNAGPSPALRLAGVIAVAVMFVGLVMGLFSGGRQLVYVPLKLTAGVFACALLCLPSLHVFSCVLGASQRIRDTFLALLLGVALTSVLLVGFAPIAWIFSQATSSAAAMGAVHLVFFLLSVVFGVGLMSRALSAMNGARVKTHLWGVLFVVVVLQMTTTLRPLVGPDDGVLLHGRSFFVAHWIASLVQ